VGEGQVDLGITGYDQVLEHDAGVRALARLMAQSGDSSPTSPDDADQTTTSTQHRGCETVMDLSFGACKLQVQIPANGPYRSGRDLVGRNVGTSFVHLTSEYFARLEMEMEADQGGPTVTNGEMDVRKLAGRKLSTKVTHLNGSVEAACALGVADGIVDLVGKCLFEVLSPTIDVRIARL
jgi:ATP phosphoribosyltransferase